MLVKLNAVLTNIPKNGIWNFMWQIIIIIKTLILNNHIIITTKNIKSYTGKSLLRVKVYGNDFSDKKYCVANT